MKLSGEVGQPESLGEAVDSPQNNQGNEAISKDQKGEDNKSVEGVTNTQNIKIGISTEDYGTINGQIDYLETQLGTSFSTVSIYKQFGLSGNNFLDAGSVANISSKGKSLLIAWEPWNPVEGLNQSTDYLAQIPKGALDVYISEFANQVKSYQKPVIIRFGHEMNGNWYPWGNFNDESTYNYVSMWVHVHNIFEEEKADNVIWVWSPNNTDQFGETDGVLDYYPGVNYVDWVAFSGFNWGNAYKGNSWMDFKTLSWPIYSTLSTLNKPIMVAETSSVSTGGDKAGWFYETLQKDIPGMPQIKAVVLFNEDYGKADFRLDSGMDADQVLYDAIVDNGYYLREPVVAYR